MNKHEPKPEPIVPDCPAELGPVARREWDRLAKRAWQAQDFDCTRSRGACGLLRGLCAVGGSNRGHPEIRHHGQIAVWLSNPVALRFDRQSSGRDHDAYCVGIRLHAGEQEQDFNANQNRTEFI